MRKILIGIFALLALIAAYLVFAPIDAAPIAWQPQPAPPMDHGVYAENHLLAGIERIGKNVGKGPEALAFGANGLIFTGFDDGRVVRFNPDGKSSTLVVNTGGRPLGLQFQGQNLLVCDAKRGLLRLDLGRIDEFSTESDGIPFGFTNDVSISKEGTKAYFTDSSSKFGYGQSTEDIVEHGGNGRLLVYDLTTWKTKTLLKGLQFPNGVALGPDGDFVLVAETGNYRVIRYWLKGPKEGTSDIFADNLPGFPDNITFNGSDRFWLAIYAPRTALVDSFAGSPFARKVLLRALKFLPEPIKKQAFVLGFDINGKLIANLQDDGKDAYAPITSVREGTDGYLYFGSLTADSLGKIKLPALPAGVPN